MSSVFYILLGHIQHFRYCSGDHGQKSWAHQFGRYHTVVEYTLAKTKNTNEVLAELLTELIF